ncbi:FAD-binding oxidoreductase [Pseudoxanthobacter sp.]|uniref:NAD(P)/FAD-dependent oxidoreductase n=1 Tax=Pseudoxanthobacter sp. TaxID=1925742 RepID=UPI002FE0A2D8
MSIFRSRSARALPSSASVVIIGGGIQGLACAFNLWELGVRDVIVLDAGYWQGGASGRNGTLIRGGFGTPEWTALFQFSNEAWSRLSRTLGHNAMFTRRGYMMVAETGRTADMLHSLAPVHDQCGVRHRMLKGRQVEEALPAIDASQVKCGLMLPDGGVAPHHAGMKAFRAACEDRGIDLRYRTAVTGIERTGGRVSAVLVGDHRIAADSVMVAAGGHNPVIAAMAGVGLPGFGMRIEAMALEPVRPLIRPALALIDSLCYMHQTGRGEVVGGTEVPERPRMSLSADLPVMAATAAVYARLFPALRAVRVLRHWAGLIHATPDYAPIIGEHPALRDLWFSGGWSYGWAGGPGTGILLARAIAGVEFDSRLRPFAIDRFERGRPLNDPAIVL